MVQPHKAGVWMGWTHDLSPFLSSLPTPRAHTGQTPVNVLNFAVFSLTPLV